MCHFYYQKSFINSESNRLLNNCWLQEEIKAIIKGFLENDDSENMPWQNLYDAAQTLFLWYISSPEKSLFL